MSMVYNNLEAADCQGRLPRWCSGKGPAWSAWVTGDTGSIPELGRCPEEGIGYTNLYSWVSLVAQTVKNLPAMRETWVRSLGWEDSLEKEMATHSSILAWKIPWTEKPGGLQSMGSQRVGHNLGSEHEQESCGKGKQWKELRVCVW